MKQFGVTLFLITTLFVGVSYGKTKETGWVFSPVVGVNKLNLDVFYDTVYNAPFVGTVQINTDLPEDVEVASAYPTEQFYFENKLSERPVDMEGSLEARRNFGKQYDFFIGIGAWETSAASKNVVVTFPLQGVRINRAKYSRRGKLSYTQYYLGIQNYLGNRKKKFNTYVNASIRALFDIDYEETNVFDFISGEPKGFKRIFIYQSQATGLLMLQLGAGMEYRFAERLSFSLEGAYAFHIKEGVLKGVSINNDYNEGDGFVVQPLIIEPINPALDAGALDEDGFSHNKVKLRFDGWHIVTKFSIAF